MRTFLHRALFGSCSIVLGLAACSGDEGLSDIGDTSTTAGSGCVASDELCDGQDNDCDGQTDEDCACIQGDTQECYSGDAALVGIGECKRGQQTCDAHGQWGSCDGEVVATDETCDGLDNNCDGAADEGFGEKTCGLGICQSTAVECIDGVPNPCVPGPPNPQGETCDGNDDDCDGDVDEDCPCIAGEEQSCYTGPPNTQGVGICQQGMQTCDSTGTWGDCIGSVIPTIEQCNGLDDDCDGTPDDGNPDGGAACDTLQPGVCAPGTEQCVSGDIECVSLVMPSNETCNNLDDDCNGIVDDGIPNGGACSTGLNGVCAAGTMKCAGGIMQCVQDVMPSAEVCDLLDNDCDGSYDETFWGDASNANVDFPNVWSTQIPLLAAYTNQYPNHLLGSASGRLLPQNDQDWFTVEATEQKSDSFGDTAIKGMVTITAPAGTSYRACVCWSTANVYCGKDAATVIPTCVTSTSGNPASVTVNMAMVWGSTDLGYLDIAVQPIGSAQSCQSWTLAWDVWE